jgi:membrane protease YdiL (CAAX protease family)
MAIKPVQEVRWRRVALFYGIALAWAIVVGVVLYLAGWGFQFAGRTLFAQLLVGVFYMPAPLVGVLVVERVYHERSLLRQTFSNLSWRVLWVALGFMLGLLFLMYGLTWVLSGDPGFPGVGDILTDPGMITMHLEKYTGWDAMTVAPVAGLWQLVLLAALGSLLAGFTINGVFAFGEEFGWRGWLANELRPLGTMWINVLTGVMWGIWYIPLILLGYNYAPDNAAGIPFMIAFCIAMSFLLFRARKLTSSILVPAILHGILNSFVGIFLLTLSDISGDRSRLISAPFGLVGTAAAALLAAAFWFLPSSES